ncbi:MAG: phage integrase SAM-like domain-containing protein [Bacteroidota bacterium]
MEEFLSAESIKLRYTGQESPKKTLLQVVEIHNKEMERKVGSNVSKTTLTKFRTLKGKLIKFVKEHQKKADYYLKQLDYSFVTEFEYFLRSKKELNSNTSMKYIRILKKIMNDAVRKAWLVKKPFGEFKCTFRWPEKEVLTMEKLQRIIDKDL